MTVCHTLWVWGKVYVCVRPGIQSEDQNQFFTFRVRTFWQSEVKISVLALWLGALSSLFHSMGVGGMDIILYLYVPGMFRGVWKKMSSLWMCYTQICPRFECRDEHTIHTCVYCVLTLSAGTGRGVFVCKSYPGYKHFVIILLFIFCRIALNQGSKRGWFSYTDLFVLMNTPEWYQACMEVIETSAKVGQRSFSSGWHVKKE